MGGVTERTRAEVEEELRRIREGVRARALLERSPDAVLPPPRPLPEPAAPAALAAPAPQPPPAPPDGGAVNTLWNIAAAPGPGGLRGAVSGLLRRLLGPLIEAQVAFNSRQVQLDNELLAYLEARLAATHRHYDAVLGVHGRHMQDIDERHLILQEELVAHVHDLVKRVDLVLSESERGRVSLEFALRDLRGRLTRLEERIGRG